jgi:lipopolysaccharide heptosyltransferase II
MKIKHPQAELDWEVWKKTRKILCLRLDGLGDFLMTTPALRALKEWGPQKELTLLASPACEEAAALTPEIDRLLIYEAPWIKASTGSSANDDKELIRVLKENAYDAAVLFTVYSQNPLSAAFLCRLAEIPLTLAYCRENPYQLLSHWIPEPDGEGEIRHEVRRQLDLVARLGASTQDETLSLCSSYGDSQAVASYLEEMEIPRPFIVVHPGASAPSRRYPAENFAAAAMKIYAKLDCGIVFSGSKNECELVATIQDLMEVPSYSLAGRLSLGQMSALLSKAALLISNNTGPVHVAAAAGTPVVDLYALTNPQHTPWQVPSRVLYRDVPCKFCYKSICPEGHQECLRLIHPDEIVSAALELLELCKKR